MFLRVLPIPGRWRIYAICDGRGEAQAVSLLTPGGPGDQHASSKRQLWAYLEHVAQLQYPPRNTTVSHQVDEEHGIYEFVKGDVRLMYFYDEDATIILSHGFIKKEQKTPKAQIERAREAVTAYFQAKNMSDLHFIMENV